MSHWSCHICYLLLGPACHRIGYLWYWKIHWYLQWKHWIPSPCLSTIIVCTSTFYLQPIGITTPKWPIEVEWSGCSLIAMILLVCIIFSVDSCWTGKKSCGDTWSVCIYIYMSIYTCSNNINSPVTVLLLVIICLDSSKTGPQNPWCVRWHPSGRDFIDMTHIAMVQYVRCHLSGIRTLVVL